MSAPPTNRKIEATLAAAIFRRAAKVAAGITSAEQNDVRPSATAPQGGQPDLVALRRLAGIAPTDRTDDQLEQVTLANGQPNLPALRRLAGKLGIVGISPPNRGASDDHR